MIETMLAEMEKNVAMTITSPNLVSMESPKGIIAWISEGPWTADCQFFLAREHGAVTHDATFRSWTFPALVRNIYDEWQRLK